MTERDLELCSYECLLSNSCQCICKKSLNNCSSKDNGQYFYSERYDFGFYYEFGGKY